MLAQTSSKPGTLSLENRFPLAQQTADGLSSNGKQNLIIAGHKVDAMGIFEWLSLTLQNKGANISEIIKVNGNKIGVRSLFLANRLYDQASTGQNPTDFVFVGRFDSETSRFNVVWRPSNQYNTYVLPRLAIF
jgi:hypothetical protein